ncbi:mitotic checkpoint regulator, MAD2B-interacting-domain-containing protein [Cantharellus anzutake]|uniref:mitotic checkpoint regulator, MAD2B-interacting-domain-containing protein n=1 Tax=Cantharellus anzutake TaxID=1750568 RepID=UPI001907CC5A|nr:mitotic checkpoint regulator, MAD2B-interacting-domain-containing protein [Cantharellus anzutake]KAF8328905.1 mitotic checkpoint regulator, MAD2B-interacting-domain-containing protein [Cantharellus anzutake]
MPLLDYTSDDDSDAEVKVQAPSEPISEPGPGKSPDSETNKGLAKGGPRSNRRRDGPVKIKVDLLKAVDSEDASHTTPHKKLRADVNPLLRNRGAGASSLLSMLPTPKKMAIDHQKPTEARGRGMKESSSQISAELIDNDTFLEIPNPKMIEAQNAAPSGLFIPPSISRLKPQPSTYPLHELLPKPKTTPPSKLDPTNFFSLGSVTASSTTLSSETTPLVPVSTSSAPVVKEFIPPEPSSTDPYLGYYQKPSGEWAAYDPAYYKTFWERWQREAYGNPDDPSSKGKRKDREWETGDGQIIEVDAGEEAKRGQIAERETRKNLTGSAAALAAVHGDAKPRMNIQAKSHGRARQRGQLSSLLVEAYENRAAIEEKLAEARRNKKEAGNKYGF